MIKTWFKRVFFETLEEPIKEDKPLGPEELYRMGGGTFPNERVAALIFEAQRGYDRRENRNG